ncbi:glutamate 5-kinase [Temperatibacter marinus]|uniref:Glutamate 5-kinase n=1 Tax=Temperatibacter marinus TaxID=1456591 RepID=A0AA52H9A8_9PROT|nr:glutamate 5-kinase [Temperatibacter marinus]WND01448.1 glutamate 5-kinase [Temperatibacter marinus]
MQDLKTLSKETCNRLIIKIGSALLVDPDSGQIKQDWLNSLAQDINELRQKGIDILIVSSGSIALGKKDLGLFGRPNKLEEAQASAAIGQVLLAQSYADAFAPFGITVAQMLLTLDDLEDRPRHLNARGTVEALLSRRIIPVINENDTVATSEIRFGDNDRLAARVGSLAKADLVVLLSDIDGLYTANPKLDSQAHFIECVPEITEEIEKMAGPAVSTNSSVGTGGMTTKIMAAKMATKAGCSLAIARGTEPHPLSQMIATGRATLFPASQTPLALRKQWLSTMQTPRGFVHIDTGAANALTKGASLLPVGVVRADGQFNRGDLVGIMGETGHLIGQGLANFDSVDAQKIIGSSSEAISKILGASVRSTLIHRDDLVLF